MEGMAQMLVVMPIVYLARNMEWTPERVFYAQASYAVAHVLVFAIFAYIRMKIQRTANEKVIDVPVQQAGWPAPQAPAETEKMTVQEYDLKEWNKFLSEFVLPFFIVAFIAYKWEAVIPLATQALFAPLRAYQHNLFKIYILGSQIDRPFPAKASPFAGLLDQSNPEADKKAAKKAAKKAKKDN